MQGLPRSPEAIVLSTRLTRTQENQTDIARPTRVSQLPFAVFKRAFDLLVSVALLIPAIFFAAVLVVLNPVFNPGKLFYSQWRMGKDCKPFRMYKFRSMRMVAKRERHAEDGLEKNRITTLGHLIRRSRIDELPQSFNVLRGDMSLIGPRPDDLAHAKRYLKTVEGYRQRHSVRPGISGLAQVTVGYVHGSEDTRRKVAKDLEYIEKQGFRLELAIILRTVLTVLRLHGS